MSGAQVFAIAIAAIAVVAAIAIFAVAFRRRPEEGAVGRLDRRAIEVEKKRLAEERQRDEEQRAAPAPAEEAAEVAPPAPPEPVPEPVPDPLAQRPELSEEEYGVTRRKFFTRSILAVFGVFLLQFTLGSLAFVWPRLKAGAFGSEIDGGDIDEIKDALINDDGTITPFFIPAAQAYIVPFTGNLEDSQFSESVVADGVMAVWQRCVHLGCRVPTCQPSQGFECPCHGSKYNFHGEYEAGPAPRNLDRFVVVSEGGRLIIDTGAVVQTARAKDKTIDYPQGPSCL